MNLLKNNLTFAILTKSGGWRADLTTRFAEYFSYQINGSSFKDRINLNSLSVDDALNSCTTDFLLIQTDGHIPFKKEFFDILNQAIEENSDIFLSAISIENEYVELDPNCIFVNMKLWKEAGCPAYNSQVREGPDLEVFTILDSKIPGRITLADTTDRIYVDQSCSSNGALIAIKQLELFGSITSFAALCTNNETYVLENSSPYKEIYSETYFEKRLLPAIKSQVFLVDYDDVSGVKDVSAKIVVAPAHGLKALSLAEYFKASSVVIYDINPLALEFQKLIFSVTKATLLEEIFAEFVGLYPSATFTHDGNWESDKHYVVQPLKNVNVSFHLVDAFSFEIEELVRTLDSTVSAVFDLSDIYVYPYNYFKHPLYQVRGLFNELYSLLKSRTGPTHIMGYAPGFQNMDSIEVNTSTDSYYADQYYVEPEEGEEGGLDIIEECIELEIVEIEKIEEPVKQVVYVPVTAIEIPVELIHHVEPVIEDVIVTEPVNAVYELATQLGYERSTRNCEVSGGTINIVILSLQQTFDEFTALFEYAINPFTNEWKFTAGKVDGEKRVEFSNGQEQTGLIKHLNQAVKINPKTALKYF
jgi:hypothetical protein